jgi:hypothetical protein
VHLCGRGEEDAGLALDNGLHLAAAPLANLLGLFQDIRCVLFSASHSAGMARAAAEKLPYAIGMEGKIANFSRIEFALAFYDALGAGESIERALEFGKVALALKKLPGDPRLYSSEKPNAPPLALENPFGDNGALSPARFYERPLLLWQVQEELGKAANLLLLGDVQSGRTSLLHYLCHLHPNTRYIDMQLIGDEDEFRFALCDTLQVPEQSFFRLDKHLRGQRFVLCLDQFECMASCKFSRETRTAIRGLAEHPYSPIRWLITSRVRLEKLFPDTPLTSSPLANFCQTIEIPPFSPRETQEFLTRRLQASGVQFSPTEIEILHRDSQGNPYRIQQLAKALFAGKTGG